MSQQADEHERRRKRAEAEKAEADAKKAAADARKAAADADKAEAEVRRSALAALVPDLGKVDDSTLGREKDIVIGRSTALAFGALQEVAEAIAETILPGRGPDPDRTWTILVTSQTALADADAAYHDVTSGLKSLTTTASTLLEQPPLPGEAADTRAGLVGAAAALAGVVPEVVSLLTAKRTLSTAAVTVSDLAAAGAVIDALKRRQQSMTIYHDDFRLLATGEVYEQAQKLAEQRQQLAARKLTLADTKARHEKDLANAKKDEKRDDVEECERKIQALAVRIGLIDSLVAVIDAYGGAIRTIPTGQTRSPLASAALHELLHGSEDGKQEPAVSHVLLVKTQGGSAEQLLDNRPLWWSDRFATVVDVSVTYMLIATADSQVVHAGTETRVVKAYGKIGEKTTIEVV